MIHSLGKFLGGFCRCCGLSTLLGRFSTHVTGKEEKTGSRVAETSERPQKSPRLDSPDSGYAAEAMRGLARISIEDEDEGMEPCHHFSAVDDQVVHSLVEKIKSRHQAPVCEHCWLATFDTTTSRGSREDPRKHRLIMVCLECMRCLCAGVGVAITDYKPWGHAWSHAHKKGHWVALWFDQPYQAYCFSCDCVLFLDQHDGENELLESAVDDESGARATSLPDTDELCYVIKGIPNCRNTCYVNALVQCLLALDKLRMWMLGPNAPKGSLGVALKELFEDTTRGNDAGAKLNPKKLLESLGALNAWYTGGTMEDSQELLLDMQKGLREEERRQLPPKMRDRFPTVVDSIFQGQISSTLTCRSCLFDSPSLVPFSEISLTLPSKGQTTNSVDSTQRSLAIEESNLNKVQIDAMDIDKASESLKTDSTKAEQVWQMENDVPGFWQTQEENISSIEQCLALYFTVEEVEWRCVNCTKVSEEAGTASPVKDSFSSSTTSEKSGCDGKAEKRIDVPIVQDSHNASTPPNRTMLIDLNVAPADQVMEDQNEQEDRKGHAKKTVVISKLPPVLTVHLKRFDRVNKAQVKVPGHVSFGENLELGQFLDPGSEDKDNSSYRLGGVIEHIGNSLNTGHYVAYVRARRIGSGSSLWFRASDERIEQVSLEQVVKCEAFVLFYERIEG